MQLILEARGQKADQLSFFFGKHPDRPFTRDTKYGVVEFKFLSYEPQFAKAYIGFHPNGLSLVRDSDFHQLDHYINDREFALSTLFLTNVRNSIGYVLGGTKEGMDELFDFTVTLSPISTRLPDDAITSLFTAIGYEVSIAQKSGEMSGKVVDITLAKRTDIVTLFKQLYTLIPVLDNYKHYQVMDDDVDKLLRYGDGWLDTHPQKEWIVKRYVGYKKGLVKNALAELVTETAESTEQTDEKKDETVVAKTPLGKLRYSAFADLIAKRGITEVVDMGAGEGRLLELLVQNKNLKTILACEPTEMGLLKMRRNFEIWERKGRVKVNPEIIQSSLFYVDERLVGKECLALCEVIEHIDIDRIDDVMSIVLSKYAPKTFLMSTPNIEYNVVYELEGFRHSDHRFEMTRTEFETFCQKHASSHGYEVSFTGIGDTHETLGQPTQLAIFTASN